MMARSKTIEHLLKNRFSIYASSSIIRGNSWKHFPISLLQLKTETLHHWGKMKPYLKPEPPRDCLRCVFIWLYFYRIYKISTFFV